MWPTTLPLNNTGGTTPTRYPASLLLGPNLRAATATTADTLANHGILCGPTRTPISGVRVPQQDRWPATVGGTGVQAIVVLAQSRPGARQSFGVILSRRAYPKLTLPFPAKVSQSSQFRHGFPGMGNQTPSSLTPNPWGMRKGHYACMRWMVGGNRGTMGSGIGVPSLPVNRRLIQSG